MCFRNRKRSRNKADTRSWTPDGRVIWTDENGNMFVGGYQPRYSPENPMPPVPGEKGRDK